MSKYSQLEDTGNDINAINEPITTDDKQIFIKTLTGKTLTISITKDTTVSELKNTIYDKERIPPDQQRLIHQGKQLEDHNKLTDYDIKNHTTVHLILRLRG